MVAFLTTWSLTDGIARSWRDLSCLAEALNAASKDIGGIEPDRPKARPESSDLLSRRMHALNLDTSEVARSEPEIFIRLRSVCSTCDSKVQCELDLDELDLARASTGEGGVDSIAWQDYCLNVATLKMLSALLPASRDAACRRQ